MVKCAWGGDTLMRRSLVKREVINEIDMLPREEVKLLCLGQF